MQDHIIISKRRAIVDINYQHNAKRYENTKFIPEAGSRTQQAKMPQSRKLNIDLNY